MPTITYTLSPTPMPYSMSPIYSHHTSSKTPSSSYRPHIIPRKAVDMIPSSTPISLITPKDSNIIAYLQAIGVFAVITIVIFVIWVLLFEISSIKEREMAKKRDSEDDDLTIHTQIHIQHINPTAYNTLNLIRRASSNNLTSDNIG